MLSIATFTLAATVKLLTEIVLLILAGQRVAGLLTGQARVRNPVYQFPADQQTLATRHLWYQLADSSVVGIGSIFAGLFGVPVSFYDDYCG